MTGILSMRRWIAVGALSSLLAACGGGFSQSVGPDGIQQNAGPFHQSVGPNGISQGTGGYGPSQSIGPGGVRQGVGGPPSVRANGPGCQVDCGGRTYVANCPSGATPVCQCSTQPYAGCLTPSR